MTGSGFPAGNYRAANRWILNGVEMGGNDAYLPVAYPDQFCGTPCDPTVGDTFASPGTVTIVPGIDFAFVEDPPATISGHIFDGNGNPGPGGAVRLFDSSGEHYGDFWVDGDGYFETYPFGSGTYFAVTRYTQNVIDDRWDGFDGEPCPNQTCDILAGTPIVVDNGVAVADINFWLDPITSGGTISGHLQDESANPLGNVIVVLWSRDGVLLHDIRTNQFGDYEFSSVVDDVYYVSTWHGPLGMRAELFDDIQCEPQINCWDGNFAVANGQPIIVSGGDYPGVDFVLSIPPGPSISGKVLDDDTGEPLSDIWVFMFDNDGNWIAEFETDPSGDYYFTGLADGNYRISYGEYGLPGYVHEVYDDFSCPDWNCDIAVDGTPVNVSGVDVVLPDVGLQYEGTRLFGTVTRTDNGDPVSNNYGWFQVNLFNDAGDHIDTSHTNSAGQYQLHLPGAGDYYVATNNSPADHGLVDECWDNFKCLDQMDPAGSGAALISVAADTTFIADFVLDAGSSISGTVTAEDGGAPLENIQICVRRQEDGGEEGCVTTDASGFYELSGLRLRDDYDVYTNDLNGLAFYKEMHLENECCDVPGDPVDTTVSDQVVDFALEASASISGRVVDSSNDNPIEYSRVWLVSEQCEFLAYGDTNANGDYIIAGFEMGTYYIAAFAEYQDYISTIYPNEQRMNVCHPDIQDGLAIVVGDKEQLPGFDFALDPGGSINGFVSDSVGVLPNGTGAARLYDFDGNTLVGYRNWQEDGSYRIGGVIPGTYQVVLTSYGVGLVDERFDDETCPRNSCDPNLGVPVVVGPEEDVMGIDAVLDDGATISGQITDKDTGLGVPGGYCVAFYTTAGIYASFACSDEDGYYESTTGLPDGDYLMANVFWGDVAPGGYLAQVWTDDGAFVECGEPCDFLLGDIFTVSGTTPVVDIDLVMEKGSAIPGSVTDTSVSPLAGIEIQLLSSFDGSVIRTVTTDACRSLRFRRRGFRHLSCQNIKRGWL